MAKPDTWMPLKIEPWTKKTARLSLAERGAYMDLLLAYWVGGPLPADDEDTLKRMARCTDKEWKQVRVKVLAFFTRDGDVLRQGRADEELADAAARYERRASAGRSGGLAKAKQPPKQNPSNATAEPQASYKEHSLQREKPAEAGLGKSPRASKISEFWQPNEKDQSYATDKGLNASTIANIAEQFRNHWLAKPKNNTSANWSLNWRTWVQNHINYNGTGTWPSDAASRSSSNRQSPRDVVGVVTRLKAGLESSFSVPEERGYSGGDRGGEFASDDGSQETTGPCIDATEFEPDVAGGVRRFAG